MSLENKLIYLLLYFLLTTEIFSQEKSIISENENIINLYLTKSIYNMSTFNPYKKILPGF